MESTKLANRHSRIFVSVHLDEGKATVGLEARLCHVPEVLEKRHKIVLRRVRGKVTDIAGGLPLRGLLHDHIVASSPVSWEVVVTEWRSGGHSHGGHCLLLGDGWLTLLVGPVATNGARSEPLPVHRAERLLSIRTVAEGDKSITTRTACLHVPHDARFRDGAKGGKGLKEDLIVHLVAKITNENMEMVGSVFLVGVVGLVGPVDTDFLVTVNRCGICR